LKDLCHGEPNGNFWKSSATKRSGVLPKTGIERMAELAPPRAARDNRLPPRPSGIRCARADRDPE
jgi:hypothetical protein